jgi:predicted AlkP superfamily pyrophosphatase or phosphodiesterase
MMKRVCGVLCALALSAEIVSAQTASQSPAKDRHVIVISLDGYAAYMLADPAVPAPNLRALARDGVMAQAMMPVNPTVTWPNHTTLVTGVSPDRHGLLYNGLPVRRVPGQPGAPMNVEPHVDKDKLVLAPTVYDLAHQAGLTTAEIDWVAIEHAKTITWAFTEYGDPQGTVQREMVAAGVVTEEDLARFPKSPITFRDELWTRAAEHLIKAHKPNLLLFHLLTTDSVQHQYGARSLGAATALALADARVGRLVEACRAAGILSTTTFVVVSDHGFKTYKKRVRANVVLKQKGLSEAAWAIPEGGTAMVYVTGAAAADKAKTVEAMKAAFTGVEGIAQVLTSAEFAQAGFPLPEKLDRMADVVVAAKDGYAFDGGVDGEVVVDVPAGSNPGSHGYLNTDPDMQAIFIASGAGVKRGATLGVIQNLDVAPTIARWLGLEMKDIAGKPLSAILQEPAPASSR